MPELRNYMEVCISDTLDDVMKRTEICRCENCRFDIMAIALNSLPPKYVVTHKGQIYTKLSMLHQQVDADVIREIIKAVQIVKKNPRHDE